MIQVIQDKGREVTREKEKLYKLNYIYIRAAQLRDECCLANATVKFLSTETAGMDAAHVSVVSYKDGRGAKNLSIKTILTTKTI